MIRAKYVTVMLIPDGTEDRRGWKVRTWMLYGGATLFVALVIGIIVFFFAYGRVVGRAALAERLEMENAELKRYQQKVVLLEENLKQAREVVTRLTRMAGVETRFTEIPPDSILLAEPRKDKTAILSRASSDLSFPSGQPVQGFVTRDFDTTRTRFHPGIDVACEPGTPVLATAQGEVIFAGVDTVYGEMIVVRHSDSVTTIFGHNDSLLVSKGDNVQVGGRIALSGNTGRSTAPHLHYEVRIHDKPINPLEHDYYDQKTIRQ